MITLLVLFLLVHLLKANSKCPKSYACRNFTLEFPFTTSNDPDCGIFTVDGCDSQIGHPTLRTADPSSSFQILDKTSTNAFLIHDGVLQQLLGLPTCYTVGNMSLPKSPFVSFTFYPKLTFFACYNQTPDHQISDYFKSYRVLRCNISTVYYVFPETRQAPVVPSGCLVAQLPIKSDSSPFLTANFTLEWKVSQYCSQCYKGGGQCLTHNYRQFYCRKTGKTGFSKTTLIGGMAIAALSSSLVTAFVFIWRKRAKAKQEREKELELFLEKNVNLAPMRYKYSNIKKMTNSFSEHLGRGGFGSVYKGKFPNGHPVAVKVLNESNEYGEDFMNEVASISRTSHINIVGLLGFCFDGSKRALIYDFMPNGSLEKFIGNNASSSQESGLGWDKLFEIALGIARGLEYLHQGCNTRILHLDVKPQNILLDKDMNPRISDFGLSKLCPNRSSVVSRMVARGTIGYMAPEVFSRNFGEVSYKSDVYSYGMLVLEMVGGRRSIDPRDEDRTSEIHFPHNLYKQLELKAERDGDLYPITIQEEEFGDFFCGTVNGEDERQHVERNLIIVGLWCIQTNPKDRPSMTRVVEMLEGKFGTLAAPPLPYL
ncbi:LEAF RUST 10 DISEASE-RESISTANCE LOCUS RECEPTOR-LIKE PROTEIN KINASE-like 2.4 [Salvia hispanica]|uniref:LEAF RUST 10 DISEASE-RESISTANCE LOCUS RECEPTOR-LIKE PROTEIN KINASE-like 2.4 n=1 Tax=Salvia hispanica TaxID=49212 RepID=UPI002009A624|nr:LEAF RUST 10 DISEASE-RESISTANCE LOCUS RECEPTOR-LIKE PROTEIN KINASE-like 2.4 [Salvia hispanica]